MAALATVFGRIFSPAAEREQPVQSEDCFRVPAFANDDIYFYVKTIHNERVVRAADPKARGTCWKLIGSVVAAAVLLVGVLLPGAYSLMAGYQIQSLKQEAQRLSTEQASLEL